MFELTQEFIAKELADERIGWTDRQTEMLTGMSDYLGHVKDDMETAIDQTTNPGLYDKVPIEEETDG
jgi:hypothetical protein